MNTILSRKNALLLVILVAVALVVGLITPPNQQVKQDEIIVPEKISLTGTIVCLPYSAEQEVTTLECAYGLKDIDGNFYALEMSMVSPDTEVVMESNVVATGIYAPLEMLSTDMWRKYAIVGVMQVETLVPDTSL